MSLQGPEQQTSNIHLRMPTAQDGSPLHKLVAASKPLDENSIYCNLLQCSHFAETAVVAERNGQLIGSITGYRIPQRPDTYFLWQVAVSDQARGCGLAGRMLQHLLQRPCSQGLNFLETTITPDNEASWALFRSIAKRLDASLESEVHFERQAHFHGAHDDEHLLRIGPFNVPSSINSEIK